MSSPCPIQLAFCIDDRFAPHLAPLLHSLQTHRRGDQPVQAHVVGTLSSPIREKLSTLSLPDFQIQFHTQVPDFGHLHISPIYASRLSLATYHRLALPALLPGISRILYLDADMLALDEFSTLWKTDLRGRSTGVVQDYFLSRQERWKLLGLSCPEYFNAGMMLMDLDQWRAEKISERVAQAVAQHPEWEYNDQDGLNTVLNGQCLYLDPRWNATTTRLQGKAVEHPALIHFTGQEKPWHVSSVHPFREAYREHKRHTPWRDEPLTHFLDDDDQRRLQSLRATLPRGGSIAIYGCGARGRRLALFLREKHPEFKIRFMVDRAASAEWNGIPVYRQMPETEIDALLIASIPYREEIMKSLPRALAAQGKVI